MMKKNIQNLKMHKLFSRKKTHGQGKKNIKKLGHTCSSLIARTDLVNVRVVGTMKFLFKGLDVIRYYQRS